MINAEVLRDVVVEHLLDMKGNEIRTLDVRHLSSVTDYMIVVTGNAGRHVNAMAIHLTEHLKSMPCHVSIEKDPNAEWILLDLGPVVVHLMQAQTREYYALEKLWAPMPEVCAVPA